MAKDLMSLNIIGTFQTITIKTSGCAAGPPARRQARAHASLMDDIKSKNSENPVMVYSKSHCPYCASVKGLFSDLEVTAKVVELDQLGAHFKNALDNVGMAIMHSCAVAAFAQRLLALLRV